jgi:flagellar biogenesis protein FliO
MIGWLNNLTGTDIATYLGAIIGIIGLFFVGAKIINKITQSQNVKNGTGIQVGGNFIIGGKDESKIDS